MTKQFTADLQYAFENVNKIPVEDLLPYIRRNMQELLVLAGDNEDCFEDMA
ncbi:MAG TPA: hypothetical protein VIK78_14515 [Ruminiclostridium sp.]